MHLSLSKKNNTQNSVSPSQRKEIEKVPHKREQKHPSDSSQDDKMQDALAKYQGAEQLMNPLIFNMKKVREAKLPSANGYSTAHGLASLYAKLIDTNNDTSLISEVLLKEARTKQLPSKKKSDLAGNKLLSDSSAAFGLGFQLHEFLLPNGKVVTSIGHAGVGGSFVLAIPELKLSIAFTTNMLTTTQIVKKELLRTIMMEYRIRPLLGNKLLSQV